MSGATQQTYRIGVNFTGEIGDLQNKLNQVRSSLQGVRLPASTAKEFNEVIERSNQQLKEFADLANQGSHSEQDIRKLNTAYQSLSNSVDLLSRKWAGLEAMDPNKLLPKDLSAQIQNLGNELMRIMDLSQGDNSSAVMRAKQAYEEEYEAVAKLGAELDDLRRKSQESMYQKLFDEEQLEREKKALDELKGKRDDLAKANNGTTADEDKAQADQIKVLNKQIEEQTQIIKRNKDAWTELEQKKQAQARNITQGQAEGTATPQQIRGYQQKITEYTSSQGTQTEKIQAAEQTVADLTAQREQLQLQRDSYAAYTQNEQAIARQESAVDKATKALERSNTTHDKNVGTLRKQEGQYATASNGLEKLRLDFENIRSSTGNISGPLEEVRIKLAALKGVDISQIPTDVNQLQGVLNNLVNDELTRVEQGMNKIRTGVDGVKTSTSGLGSKLKNDFNGAAQSMMSMHSQLNQLSQRMLYFFSLTNGWTLLRRAIHEAYETVKELDDAMSEIAVVSKYTVDEIWAMRDKFSAAATQMGAKTIDLVDATKLYVQQGLELNQAMEVGIETTKMARIANLDGAEATNLMTAALRGFNMEMNEAIRVNDTYSQLAAKSAADTEEIATAMSKTASIAANAGSSFENMSAFLTQIIETTREAPETAGTAMKTIIARFQELKKPMSEIGEIDGEVVDANGIETALRSAGVQLRDTNGEFRDFDEVILELSGKWDNLSLMTQRYIATMAAGSRQQSRFIALMSDNARLNELVTYANNASGASAEQFGKTLDTLEARMNKLNNSLALFWTNLANNKVIKWAIGVLDQIISLVNELTEDFQNSKIGIMNFIGSALQIGMLVGAFSLQRKAIFGLFSSLSAAAASGGAQAGTSWVTSFRVSLAAHGGLIGVLKVWGAQLTKFLASMKIKAVAFGKSFATAFKGAGKGTVVKSSQVKQLDRLTVAQREYDAQMANGSITEAERAKITAQYNAGLEKNFQQLGLNNQQQATQTFLTQNGVKSDIAAKLALDGYNHEKLEQEILTMRNNGATEAEIAAKVKETIATETNTRQLHKNNMQYNGLGTKLGGLTVGLFGFTSAQRAAGAATAGLSTQTSILGKTMMALPIGWILVIIGAVIQAVSIFNKMNETTEERLNQVNKSLDQTKQLLSDAQTKLSDLTDARKDLHELNVEFNDMVKGTEEWKERLVEINQQVLDLLTKFPELAQYIGRGYNGELVISNEGWDHVIEQQKQAVLVQQSTNMALQSQQGILTAEKGIEEGYFDWGMSKQTQTKLLSLIGERGIGYDSSELQSTYIEVTGSNAGFVQFQSKAKHMGEAFDALTRSIYKNQVQVEAQSDAITTYITSANPLLQESEFLEQAKTAIDLTQDAAPKTLEQLEMSLGSMYDHNDGKIRDSLKIAYSDATHISLPEIEKMLEDGDLDEDTMAYTVDQHKQNEKASKQMEKTVQEFERLSKAMDPKKFSAFKKLLSGEGTEINNSELQFFKAKLGDDLDNISEKDIENLLAREGTSLSKLGHTYDSFMTLLTNAYNADEEIYDNAYAINDEFGANMREQISALEEAIGEELSTGLRQKYADMLSNVELKTGQSEEMASLLKSVLETIPMENLTQAISAITDTDFSSQTAIITLNDTLIQLGQKVSENLIPALADFTNAFYDWDIGKLIDKIAQIGTTITTAIRTDTKNFSESDYETLTSSETGLGLRKDDFVKFYNQEGEPVYAYIGERSLYELNHSLRSNNIDFSAVKDKSYIDEADIQLTTITQSLEKAKAKREQVKENYYATYYSDKFNEYFEKGAGKDQKQKFAEKGNNDDLKLTSSIFTAASYSGETDHNKANVIEYLKDGGSKAMVEMIEGWIGTLTEAGRKELARLVGNAPQLYDYRMTGTSLIYDVINYAMNDEGSEGTLTPDEFIARMKKLIENGYASYDKYIQATQDIDYLEGQKKDIDDYLQGFVDSIEALETNNFWTYFFQSQDLTYGFNFAELNSQDEEVRTAYQKWAEILATDYEISEALTRQLSAAIESESLPDWNLMEQIIEEIDVARAQRELTEKLTDILSNVDVINGLQIEGQVRAYQDIVDKILPKELAIEINTSNLEDIKGIIQLIGLGNYEAWLELMSKTGIETDKNGWVDSAKSGASTEQIGTAYLQGLLGTDAWEGEAKDLKGRYVVDENLKVTLVDDEFIKKAEEQQLTHFNVVRNLSKNQFEEISSNTQTDQWENSYDWLYNLQKRMNKELRERNKLETEENRILEDRGSVSEMLNNLGAQTRSILQSQSQNDLLKAKRMEEKALWEKDVKAHGLQSYMWMTKDGVMQINHDKIDAIKGTAEGETIEKFLSEGEFLQDEFEAIEDNQEENTDALREIKKKYFEDAVSLEEEIVDALYTLREREIERLSDISDAITEGNEKMINRISDQVSDMRTEREDQESLDEINEMERRLALMRTDTSGTNALDILSLEKDLEEARQEYQDSQIDRAIDEMTKQNEEAAEQRQKQIDLMKEQLDADKDYGQLAKQADQLMLQEMQGGGSETIKALLTEVGNEGSLGRYAQTDFENALHEKITKGIVGAIKAGAANAGEEITFTDKYGTSVTGKVLADGSVQDKNGNVYTNVYSAGQYDAEGNLIYQQHDSGKTFTKQEWETETQTNASTLNIGKADQVQVTGTTVNVTGKPQDKAFYGTMVTDVAKAIKDNGNAALAQKISGMSTWTQAQKDKFLTATGYGSWNELGSAYVNKKITDTSIQKIYDTIATQRFSGATAEDVAKYLDQNFGGTYGATIRTIATMTNEKQQEFLSLLGVKAWADLGRKISDNEINPDEILEKRKSLKKDTSGGGGGGGPKLSYANHIFATGGLADFTGPAWLDGTKSRPEYVLNAAQTQGFLTLVDILDNFDADKTKKGSGDNYYDVHIEVDEISNDYDVEQLMDKMKRIIADDAMYRNVNAVDLGRR